MDETTLSVFVDEHRRFLHPDPSSRFYIVGMVFHDQRVDITKLIEDFETNLLHQSFANIGCKVEFALRDEPIGERSKTR